MARTKKAGQPKAKKKRARKQKEAVENNGDAMEIGNATEANVGEANEADVTGADSANEGDEVASGSVSVGKLKKKQRWQQKMLKVKVGNLKKERLKLGKKNPEHKADRKKLTKQMKALLAEQQKAHAEERQQGKAG